MIKITMIVITIIITLIIKYISYSVFFILEFKYKFKIIIYTQLIMYGFLTPESDMCT